MKKTVIAFGEVLWDLLPDGAKLGGAPCNFAYRINSLGDEAWMVSRLGQDARGTEARARLEALGMSTEFLQRDDDLPTGTVQVTLGPGGSPDFHIVPEVAYDRLEAPDELLQRAARADLVCFGTLVQRSETARQSLHRLLDAAPDPVKLLDINLRKNCYSEDTIRGSLKAADILKLNEDEARYLNELVELGAGGLPDFARAVMKQWDLTNCVITLGAKGVLAASVAEIVHVPGFEVEVADTCGSGDAFTAGFTHCLLHGKPLGESAAFGCALGALVATQSGATDPVSREQIEELLGTDRPRVVEPDLKEWMTGG